MPGTDGIIDNREIFSSFDVGYRSSTAGNREDLLDVITILTPTETPFLSGLGKDAVYSVNPEWLIDVLEAYGDEDVGYPDVEIVPESYDATFSKPDNRKRLSNLTHILRKTVDVSDTQRAVRTAGMEDEYVYQLQNKLIAIAKRAEFALVHSQRNSQATVGNIAGTPAEGRSMEGILNWLEPDPSGVTADYLAATEEGTITESGSPFRRITETLFNDHLQAMWDKGVLARVVYVNKIQKREISQFTTNVQRNLDAADRRQINNIDWYEGDFGAQAIVLHRNIPTRTILTLDETYWRIGILRPLLAVELAKVGNSTKAMIELEFTLRCLAPATGGKIIWCSDTYGATT